MPIYVFTCKAGHKSEQIVPYDTQTFKCPVCGKQARREGIELPAKRNPAHGYQT